MQSRRGVEGRGAGAAPEQNGEQAVAGRVHGGGDENLRRR